MSIPALVERPDIQQQAETAARVSIVIPAFNEEGVIHRILDELALGHYYEIIVVDDGSKDKTAEVAQQHGAKVVRHPYNIGNGGAVKSGCRAATGDIIVLMDGDGQHPPSDIPRLIGYIGDYDMVVGARTRESEASWHRTFANNIFNRYASYIVGYPVPDLTSGFRAVKAPLMKKFLYLLPNGFSYPTTITIAMFRSGFRVRYEPIVSPRRVGRSKIRPLQDGFRFLMTITRLATLFVPMKIFLPIALVFILIGGGWIAYSLAEFRRFSDMGGMLVVVGVFVFLVGLISEQIAMLRLQHTVD